MCCPRCCSLTSSGPPRWRPASATRRGRSCSTGMTTYVDGPWSDIGHLVKSTGDGILATFDGPGRAIDCAKTIAVNLEGIDLRIRAGIHTGEIELGQGDIGGIAVNMAARVMSAA